MKLRISNIGKWLFKLHEKRLERKFYESVWRWKNNTRMIGDPLPDKK